MNRAGDDLLAKQLQAGDSVFDTKHVQRRATSKKQTRVSMAPAQSTDRPLNTNAETHEVRFHLCDLADAFFYPNLLKKEEQNQKLLWSF